MQNSFLGVYETSRDSGILPSWLPSVAVGASGAASLSGFALSLLLASRTTNSYGRWLEAANLVGAVGAASTNFVRQAYAWIPDGDESEGDEEEEKEEKEVGNDGEGGTKTVQRRKQRKRREPSGRQIKAAAARWAAVLPRALASRVREDVNLAAEASRVLDPREAEALAAAPDAPRFVLAALSAIAASAPAASVSVSPGSGIVNMDKNGGGGAAEKAGRSSSTTSGTSNSTMARMNRRVTADSGFRISMDDGLTSANAAVAGCERLLRLPIPLSYTRHTSRVLVIALAFLPATLWKDCGVRKKNLGSFSFFLFSFEVEVQRPAARKKNSLSLFSLIRSFQTKNINSGPASRRAPSSPSSYSASRRSASRSRSRSRSCLWKICGPRLTQRSERWPRRAGLFLRC